MILLIDNYDSFTWNLVQRIGELDAGFELRVVRNDQISVEEAVSLRPSHVIISPGPCSPNEAGISNDIVHRFAGKTPLLGVCLGHQCIGHTHGMTVTRHSRIMHGKTSLVKHDGRGIYKGLPNPFVATRYHSLVVLRETMPATGWEVSAWTEEELDHGRRQEVIMGLRRVGRPGDAPLEGVQFHPESFLTVDGPKLLANFLGVAVPAPSGAAGR